MQKNYAIKTFVKRNMRISERQKSLYQELSPKYCIKVSEKLLNFEDVFGNKNETIIEIGFGSGIASYKIALDNPDKNYLGIEVFKTGVVKLLDKIDQTKIENIRIIEDDALEVLNTMIADNSVKAFHIFFPDPWPKKRHHKRRLMQNDKLELFTKKLISSGYIYFVSDWAEYAESALAELKKIKDLKNCYDGFAEKQIWRPQTNFERKALEAGREIFELLFEKV